MHEVSSASDDASDRSPSARQGIGIGGGSGGAGASGGPGGADPGGGSGRSAADQVRGFEAEGAYEHATLMDTIATVDLGRPAVPIWRGMGASSILSGHKMSFAKRHVPMLEWLPRYSVRGNLPGDFTAAVSSAVLMAAEGIAYALLAGLPPQVGLMTGVLPTLTYALFGTCRQLSVGPVSLAAVVTGEVVAGLGTPEERAAAAAALALSTAFFFVLFAALRLGFLENVMSAPVMEGFMTAVAVTVMASQVTPLLGITPHGHGGGGHGGGGHGGAVEEEEHVSHKVWTVLGDSFSAIGTTNSACVGISALALTTMFGMRWLKKRPWAPRALLYVPEVLLAMALTTLITYGASLHEGGVDILGKVPAGLSTPRSPSAFSGSFFSAAIGPSVMLGLVGWIESVTVARHVASLGEYTISSNSEFLALGACNFMGAFFGAMPVAGSIGRTQAAWNAGARTQASGAMSALLVLAACFGTGALHYLPLPTVSSILVLCVSGLLEVHAIPSMVRMRLWKDLALFTSSFVLAIVFGVEMGLIMSAAVSVVVLIKNGTVPATLFIGRVPSASGGGGGGGGNDGGGARPQRRHDQEGAVARRAMYKPLARRSEARPVPGIAIIQPSCLFFLNALHLKKVVARVCDGRGPAGGPMPSWLCPGPEVVGVVLDMSNVDSVDFTAVATLVEIARTLTNTGVLCGLTGLRPALRSTLGRHHALTSSIDKRYFVTDLDKCVRAMEAAVSAAVAEAEAMIIEASAGSGTSGSQRPPHHSTGGAGRGGSSLYSQSLSSSSSNNNNNNNNSLYRSSRRPLADGPSLVQTGSSDILQSLVAERIAIRRTAQDIRSNGLGYDPARANFGYAGAAQGSEGPRQRSASSSSRVRPAHMSQRIIFDDPDEVNVAIYLRDVSGDDDDDDDDRWDNSDAYDGFNPSPGFNRGAQSVRF